MNRLVLLLTPLVVVAAFASLLSEGKSRPPPWGARLALAVALYSALTAIEWFFFLKDNGYLIVEWKDFVLWPFFDLPASSAAPARPSRPAPAGACSVLRISPSAFLGCCSRSG